MLKEDRVARQGSGEIQGNVEPKEESHADSG